MPFAVLFSLLLSFSLPGAWSADAPGAPDARAEASCVFEILGDVVDPADTTGLRREFRRVVVEDDAARFLEKLKEHFGDRMIVRDLPRDPSLKNVTVTDYLEDIPLLPRADGSARVAKIRIREYHDRPVGDVMGSTPTPEHLEYARLEFKIDHPVHPDVVLKPVLTLKKSDIDLLLKSPESFSRNFLAIFNRALRVKGNKPELVRQMLRVLRRLHDIRPQGLGRSTQIEYERIAYKIQLKGNSNLELQVTQDRSIRFRVHDPETGVTEIGGHPEDYRVLETKVPLEIAAYGPDDMLRKSPDTMKLMQLLDEVKQVDGIAINKGKGSSLKKIRKKKEAP